MNLSDPALGAQLRFRMPDVSFGDGTSTQLEAVLDRYDIERPLIVTDEGVAEAGVLDAVIKPLSVSVTVYYAETEPSTNDFDDLPTADVDGVVAIGGGSCLDAGKLAALLLSHGGSPADYVGVNAVPEPTAPLVAVPTTSGTGSQATQTVVVTHEGVKRGISDEFLRPDAALVDPQLTVELSRPITARSGFDAFVHALESLTARDYRWVPERPITYQGANPLSRPLSRQALHLVYGSLEQAAYNGTDMDARRAVSLGSHLAGTAFSNAGLGAVHAIASTVGGMTGRPHGECLAVSLRPGLEYNLPVRKTEYAAVGHDLGITRTGTDDKKAAQALIDESDRLRESLELPESLEAVGLDTSDLDAMVENTLIQERRLKTNPRTVTKDIGEVLARHLE